MLNPGSVAESRCALGSAVFRAIVLEDGSKLATLRDAIAHLAKLIPKAERDMPQILIAAELLTHAAEHGGPVEFARIATLHAIVAQGLFRILVNRHDDCLDVLATPAFSRGPRPDFRQRFNPWRVVGLFVVPLQRFRYSSSGRPGLSLWSGRPALF
jgi:hypothetical protein